VVTTPPPNSATAATTSVRTYTEVDAPSSPIDPGATRIGR
jgi:hypothetical protein